MVNFQNQNYPVQKVSDPNWDCEPLIVVFVGFLLIFSEI